MRATTPLAVTLACASLLAAGARAQSPAGPLPAAKGAPQQAKQDEPQIRVRVDLVTTPVTVRDGNGQQVYDLASNEFRIFDDGVEQKIERFDMGGVPLSVAIVLETSSRIEPLADAVRRTGIVFTQTVLGETGEGAVLTADDTIGLQQDWTADHNAIESAFKQFRLGTRGLKLYDAMGRAVEMLTTRSVDRRRVLIVISEADDDGSQIALGEVLRQAQQANVTIYSVGLSSVAAKLRGEPKSGGPAPITPPGTFGRPGMPGSVQTPGTEAIQRGNINILALGRILVEKAVNMVGDDALEAATAATGGMHSGGFKDSSIERAVSAIGGELHSQYLISYRPAGVTAGGYHEIEVRVRRANLRVRARPGYYLPANSPAGSN